MFHCFFYHLIALHFGEKNPCVYVYMCVCVCACMCVHACVCVCCSHNYLTCSAVLRLMKVAIGEVCLVSPELQKPRAAVVATIFFHSVISRS